MREIWSLEDRRQLGFGSSHLLLPNVSVIETETVCCNCVCLRRPEMSEQVCTSAVQKESTPM